MSIATAPTSVAPSSVQARISRRPPAVEGRGRQRGCGDPAHTPRPPVPRMIVTSPAPLLPQLRPVVQPFPDLALEAAVGRIVEGLPAELLREVVLAGKGLGRIVIVVVTRAVALGLHQLGRRIEDVLGRQQRARLLGGAHRRAKGHIGGVRFRRGRDIDHRLRDREFALGRAEKVVGVLGGVADHQRLRIGKPDILDRHPHHAAREIERVLAGVEHAGRDSRARRRDRSRAPTCAAPRSGCSGRPASCRRSARGAARSPAAPRRRTLRRHARRARPPRPASAPRGRRRPPCGSARRAPRHRAAAACLRSSSARASSFSIASRVERLEHQNARARQHRRIQLKGRIFGGRADQHDGAVLHHRQETVLLGAVEAVDLVDEQQRALPGLAPRARLLEHPLEIGDAGEDRGNLLEMQIRSRRRGAAPPWSCRCRAAPRRPGSRASGSRACASARRRVRADDPGRRPRSSACGRSLSASGRGASSIEPGSREQARSTPRLGRVLSSAEHDRHLLAAAHDGDAPHPAPAARRRDRGRAVLAISSLLTETTRSPRWKP